jgi:glycosyltransferase involved in cell wall biosynthesis
VNTIKNKKVLVVLMTWKRLENLAKTLDSLAEQSYKGFHLHISHGNFDTKNEFLKIARGHKKKISLTYSVDENSLFSFRRFTIARRFVEKGQGDIVLFLDDDIEISENYIEECLNQYVPETYKSGWAFRFLSTPPNYFDRERIFNKDVDVHYCGPGISMIDGSFFLNKDFFTKATPNLAYILDDLWISFFVKKIGWSLRPLDVRFAISGDDDVSLFRSVGQAKIDYAKKLFSLGWDLG